MGRYLETRHIRILWRTHWWSRDGSWRSWDYSSPLSSWIDSGSRCRAVVHVGSWDLGSMAASDGSQPELQGQGSILNPSLQKRILCRSSQQRIITTGVKSRDYFIQIEEKLLVTIELDLRHVLAARPTWHQVLCLRQLELLKSPNIRCFSL